MVKVLSLFDGMSGARVALDELNIPCKFYASEIDKYAIKIASKNYPDIAHLGDVSKLGKENLYPQEIKDGVDLIVFGSPCQNLSISGDRAGLKGEQSKLFYEAVRIMKDIPHKYFLMENVKSMSKDNRKIITEILGVESIMLNSALLVAQQRKRLYWTNILNITQPEDRHIYLKDILESGFPEKLKSYCIDASYFKGTNLEHYLKKHVRQVIFDKPVRVGHLNEGGQGDRIYSINGKSVSLSANGGGRVVKTGLYCVAQRGRYNSDGSISQKLEPRFDGKTNTLTTVQKDNKVLELNEENICIRKLTPVETERLQGYKDDYSKGVSDSQRYKMIGNSFTVPVIKHILSHAKFN